MNYIIYPDDYQTSASNTPTAQSLKITVTTNTWDATSHYALPQPANDGIDVKKVREAVKFLKRWCKK